MADRKPTPRGRQQRTGGANLRTVKSGERSTARKRVVVPLNDLSFAQAAHAIARGVAASAAEQKAGVGIYRMGPEVVEVRRGQDGAVHMHPLTVQALRVAIAHRVRCLRVNKDGGTREVDPPRDLTQAVIESPGMPIPEIRHTTYIPTYVAGGRLVASSGYDSASRVLAILDASMVEALDGFDPTAVSEDDARDAINWVSDELLGDFPFPDDADEDAALAMYLQPFVRPLFKGASPLYVPWARVPRTGKGLLVNAVLYAALGVETEPSSVPSKNEEWEKKILAKLRTSPHLAWFDNTDTQARLNSGALAMAVTAWPTFNGRILGKSEIVSVQNQCVWVITGNNPRASEEIVLRAVPSLIEWTGKGLPADRDDFAHPDLLAWAADNRAQLIRAALMIIAHWVKIGMPAGSVKMGGFEGWAATMSGILESVGYTDLLKNRTAFLEMANTDAETFSSFVQLWASLIAEGRRPEIRSEMFADELAEMVRGAGLFDFKGADPARALGKRLAERLDRETDGYRLGSRKRGGRRLYILEPVEVG